MKLLAFDTSTEQMAIAVQHGNAVFDHVAVGGAAASATLIPAILALLQRAGLILQDLDAICFGRGPGSFTGLRTACSVAQGLAFGAHVPVLPIDTLLALAQTARMQQRDAAHPHICAALDARMGQVYYSYYDFSSYPRIIDKGLSLVYPQNMHVFDDFEHLVLAGNVRPVYDALLPCALRSAAYVHCLPDARAMLQLAPALLAAGQAVAAQDAQPVYVRDKVAQTTQEREALAPL